MKFGFPYLNLDALVTRRALGLPWSTLRLTEIVIAASEGWIASHLQRFYVTGYAPYASFSAIWIRLR